MCLAQFCVPLVVSVFTELLLFEMCFPFIQARLITLLTSSPKTWVSWDLGVGGRGRMSLCGEDSLPEQFDQGPVSQKPCCLLRWRLANKPVHFVKCQLNQFVKLSKFRSLMYTHSSFQDPVRTGTFERLANRVHVPQGMPYVSTGRVYFWFFPWLWIFKGYSGFLLSWKTQLIKFQFGTPVIWWAKSSATDVFAIKRCIW